MKTEDLKAQGLTDEQIAFVMAENGKDVKREKDKADGYKSQLDTAKESLKAFDGVDVAELRGQIKQLTDDLAAKESECSAKLADMEFNSVLDGAITTSGVRNAKALRALLDVEKLKESKNQAEDIKSAIEAVKAENDYLFASAEPIKNPVKATNNPPVAGITKEAFAKMGYSERLSLKRSNPEKYNELKG